MTYRLSSPSLRLAATSAPTWHRNVIFQLLAWHLGWCRFGLGLCLAAQSVQPSATKVVTSGFPLHNTSSADEEDAAPNGQPPEQELPSGWPLHGRRPSLKILQFLKWLLHKITSWRNEPAEHGNVHPLALNVLTCPQPQNILHPFDAVHNTPRALVCSQPGASHQGHRVLLWERGWWCYAAQHPARLGRQLPLLEPFPGPFTGGFCIHLWALATAADRQRWVTREAATLHQQQ